MGWLTDLLEAAAEWLPTNVLDFAKDKIKTGTPLIAGVLFGIGWSVWADAIAVSPSKVAFSQYLPGLVATLALLMISGIRREEVAQFDPFDSEVYCRSRAWLLSAYLVSFGAIVGAVVVMTKHYSLPEEDGRWLGVASVLQVASILGGGLVLFASSSEEGGGGYTGF